MFAFLIFLMITCGVRSFFNLVFIAMSDEEKAECLLKRSRTIMQDRWIIPIHMVINAALCGLAAYFAFRG